MGQGNSTYQAILISFKNMLTISVEGEANVYIMYCMCGLFGGYFNLAVW